ncbi:hypothetical protein BST81_16895, partial [Leptolyngbya sp. 'hensonii']|uniref:ShlB/FhaC/HecB family hemolysin secretion/activation protein n=1 Tax=Leptolyngbya sp. 'hensonii' TaxID=1922337 RepID=UPI000961C36F
MQPAQLITNLGNALFMFLLLICPSGLPTIAQEIGQRLPASPEQQSDPNRNQFNQPTEVAPLPSTPPVLPQQPAPVSPELPVSPEQHILIHKIQVIGNTIIPEQELQALTQSLEGKETTIAELVKLADRITQLYLQRGYITSRAVIPNQSLVDGKVQIQVVEGTLESVEIEGTQQVSQDYIRDRIALAQLKPLNQFALEDQLRLLQADPLFKSVTASLRPGSRPGQAVLTVQVEEANPLVIGTNIDNYSPPAVGGERAGGSLTNRNLSGTGDQLSIAATSTLTGGAQQYDLSYRIPL